MEQPVALQGQQILTAMALGFGMSLLYDLLRGIRRLLPVLTGLLDLDIGTWQKYCLKYFILVTIMMTAFACVTGLFTF